MDLTYQQQQPSSRRLTGFLAVVLLHVFIVWALVSGLARDVVEVIKKPLETKIIAEIKPPPPPPPPPPPKEIQRPPPAPKAPPPPPFVPPPDITPPAAPPPPITAVTPAPPPVQEYKIEPPPPAAPPAPPVQPAVQDIGVVCPTQVKPELPRKALQDGVSGVVRAQVKISGGAVREVSILSGPRVYHASVKAAMQQYKCEAGPGEVIATQEFAFKIE